ncbi:MAG: YigZ family protein, partial [Clostridia bacterium]|nr:YigZ family protein [Clostridia bacterium]
MSGFKTVVGETESITVIERSKFICMIKGIETEAEAREYVDFARKKYPLANHYCYAYVADEKGVCRKFSDDGEPHGTAGMPILTALTGRGLCKIVAVVVRYFGGIKLGTGGLSRAYGGACLSAIENADMREISEAEFYSLALSYAGYEKIAALISEGVVSTEFGEGVKVKIAVRPTADGEKSLIDKISDTLGSD